MFSSWEATAGRRGGFTVHSDQVLAQRWLKTFETETCTADRPCNVSKNKQCTKSPPVVFIYRWHTSWGFGGRSCLWTPISFCHVITPGVLQFQNVLTITIIIVIIIIICELIIMTTRRALSRAHTFTKVQQCPLITFKQMRGRTYPVLQGMTRSSP